MGDLGGGDLGDDGIRRTCVYTVDPVGEGEGEFLLSGLKSHSSEGIYLWRNLEHWSISYLLLSHDRYVH